MVPIKILSHFKRFLVACKNEIFNIHSNRLTKMEEKYPLVKIHTNVYISSDSLIEPSVEIWDDVYINNCTIGKCTYIASSSKVQYCEIGRFCSIGPEVKIGLGKHPTSKFVSTFPAFYSPNFKIAFIKSGNNSIFQEFGSIKIGNDVWIGARVLILDGITIGDGAIIGAGAVVTKDVEPYSIVVGIPAKKVRKRFSEDQISFLLKFRWWDKDDEWFKAHSYLFDDIDKFVKSLKT